MKKATKKQKLFAVPFAVIASLAVASSAFAAEVDTTKVQEPTPIVESVDAVKTTEAIKDVAPIADNSKSEAEKLQSNNDSERRDALKNKFKVELSDEDRWEDKKGQTGFDPYGSKVEYTSHDQLKALGIYATNANRQELVQYGIRTGDWQPYRAFEAEKTPAYFEVVNGKYEYNKVFYGMLIENSLRGYADSLVRFNGNDEKVKEIQAERDAYLKEHVKLFNDAPGIAPYVVGLNHNEATINATGAKAVDKDYFDSKYNHPDVYAKGTFDPAKVKAEEEAAKKAEEAKKLEEAKKAEEAKKLEEAKKAEEVK